MTPKIVVIVAKYARNDGTLEIGGVETYVTQLAKALGAKYEVCVFQLGHEKRVFTYDHTTVTCVPVKGFQQLVEHVESNVLSAEDILIVSTEQMSVEPTFPRTIVIQHGVYWDLAVEQYASSKIGRAFPNLYKLFENNRNYRRIKNYKHVVCVDYAYSNWLRTFIGDYRTGAKYWIIPNHADSTFFEVAPPEKNTDISILFARRFMRFRGTREFSRVAKRLTQRHANVRITFCGEGPELAEMQAILPQSERVRYIRSRYDEMPEVIAQHHIVVVPSLGSEGTSLSAIEGMAAGRAVVASAVGGLTNIILDGYSGVLVQPGNEDQFFTAIDKLIVSADIRLSIGSNARAYSNEQLSFTKWSERWNSVIEEFA